MMNYHGDYWSWYNLPVPVRKYLVKRCVERQEKSKETKPLSVVEKKKFATDAAQSRNISPFHGVKK
jgi:hypothetical protein